MTRRQFLRRYGADSRLLPLIRSGWMADGVVQPDSACTVSELLRLVDSGQCRLPLHVATLGDAGSRARLFIVDDHWPAVDKT